MLKNFLFALVILSGLLPGGSFSRSENIKAQAADPILVGAGDIANCGPNSTRDSATANLLDNIPGTVFTLGDNAYPDGTLAQFTSCYGPTWGRHKARTRPTAGNHDYHVTGAGGYYTYFGKRASPLDTNCTSNCRGYYSYNLGAWHIIALNSEIDHSLGSPQERWLRADLAANRSVCTLAYWHKPLFSSGQHGNIRGVKPFWDALYAYGADVVLSGHDHLYERFAPQTPAGQASPDRGIREFVVGTGGSILYRFSQIRANSEVRNNRTWGVLKLTLHPTSYSWEFVPIAGQTFTDAGSADCVNLPPDLIFANGFESGNFSAWSSSVTDNGDLSVSAAAALVGNNGLLAVLNDNNSIYLSDDNPNAERRYRARFYFDPNSITMADGDTHTIFNGYMDISTLVFRVEFRRFSSNYQLRAGLVNDGTVWTNTAWLNISDAPHSIEADWRAATSAGANDGFLKLWIDGTQPAGQSGVDNDTRQIDHVRLGAVEGIDTDTRGTYYFDAFVSRRRSYIGPSAALQTTTKTAIKNARVANVRIVYTPYDGDFANPERGFMKQSSIFPDQPFDPNKVRALKPSDSLVWIYFRLDKYRGRPLDEIGLNTIESAFTTARIRGLKLVIRFAYNGGVGSTIDPNLAKPDVGINRVRQHINQLRPILAANADVIAVVQAGFVGHWGEWHSTKFLHDLEDRRAIVDALLSALPADRMIQLRYPRYKELFFQGPLTSQEAFTGTDRSRVGHHNDCFLRDQDDGGTYKSTTSQLPKQHSTFCDGRDEISCWKGFIIQESQFTPVGGETCQYNPPRTDCPNTLLAMERFHWSFINNGYRAQVLNSWISGGCMSTIRRSLGYRLTLKEALIPQTIQAGSALNLNVLLSNDGFASMYNPRPLFVVLLGPGGRYEIPVTNVDPRRWSPGQEYSVDISVNIPANIIPGTYRLGLWLPDAYSSLRNNPKYSVRFANTGVWVATTGINVLTADLEVAK